MVTKRQRPGPDDVLGLFDLEQVGQDAFEGLSAQTDWGRIFGGQVIAQALVAANKTVPDYNERPAHSFHSHFLRPGNPDIPILYEVDHIRDGRSFRTRHVRATQNGKGILMATVSYQERESGFEHQMPMPDVPGPDEVALSPEALAKKFAHLPEDIRKQMTKPRPIEMRFITEREMHDPKPADPQVDLWFRMASNVPVGDDPLQNIAAFTFASDMTFMDTALVPHGTSLMDRSVHGVSLDHSIWFHEPIDMTKWHLFVRESPWASHARGFVRGMVFRQDGKLVASIVQECLIRKMGDD